MDSTTINITYHQELPEDKNVLFSVEDASGYPLLHDYTMEEMCQLDDERLQGVLNGVTAIKALFEEVLRHRNERQEKIAQEMEQLIGEKIIAKSIPIGTPNRKVQKYEEPYEE